MCAIAGYVANGIIPSGKFDAMLDSMAHRGPDGRGTWSADGIWLGHRRLAILDLASSGAQPMHSDDGRWTIVFNGEIYNFLELRRELEAKGAVFRGSSDTEVVLSAFAQWGEACLQKFNGMWAFALWDSQQQSLFLARDRFGVKPLHFIEQRGRFAFASEPLSFRHLPDFRLELDELNTAAAIGDVFGLEATGHTIFRGVNQLPAGCCGIVRGGRLRMRRWWDTAAHLESPTQNLTDAADEFRLRFDEACRLRLRSDVPVATALSGGLDSSSVYATVRSLSVGDAGDRRPSQWQTAYAHSLPGTAIDETEYARAVVAYCRGRAEYFTQKNSEVVASAIRAFENLDFIYLTPAVMNDLYAAMRTGGCLVSLDGHGADEMLYGYPDSVLAAYWSRKNGGSAEAAAELDIVYRGLFHDSNGVEINLRQAPRLSPRKYRSKLARSISAGLSRRRSPMAFGLARADLPHPLIPLPVSPMEEEGEALLFEQFHHTVLPTLLRNYDRASMSAGVESRMPFMDWRVVTFCFSQPANHKVGAGVTKRLLREAMGTRLPDSVRDRTWKVGWNAPMIEWFGGPMAEFLSDEVRSRAFLENGIFDGQACADFACERIRNRSWTWTDCVRFWPYFSACRISRNLG